MTVIINPNVHADSKLSRSDFLDRVGNVRAVRSNKSSAEEGLTVYIHSLRSFHRYRHLQDAVLHGDFGALDGEFHVRHFGIEIADSLYLWLRRCPLDLMYRQVVCWLSAMYAYDRNRRHIMREQLYAPIMDEIVSVYEDLYGHMEPIDEWTPIEEIAMVYRDSCRKYYGSEPPPILDSPGTLQFSRGLSCEWGVRDTFDFWIGRGWLRESDWERIVKNGDDDPLLRVESREDIWVKWKHQFAEYDSHQDHIFGIFEPFEGSGYIYLISNRASGHVKIGFTRNSDIEKRKRALQTGSDAELQVLGMFACANPKSEKLLHEEFARQRKVGEWFALDEAQIASILDIEWRRKRSIF